MTAALCASTGPHFQSPWFHGPHKDGLCGGPRELLSLVADTRVFPARGTGQLRVLAMIARAVSGNCSIPVLPGLLGERFTTLVSPVGLILDTWPDFSHLTAMGDSTRRLPQYHRLLSDLDWLWVSSIGHLARYRLPQDPSRVHACVREGLAGLWLMPSMNVVRLWWVWRM